MKNETTIKKRIKFIENVLETTLVTKEGLIELLTERESLLWVLSELDDRDDVEYLLSVFHREMMKEHPRWTDRVCPLCGAWIRAFGGLSEGVGRCSKKCLGKKNELRIIELFPTKNEYLLKKQLEGKKNEKRND